MWIFSEQRGKNGRGESGMGAPLCTRTAQEQVQILVGRTRETYRLQEAGKEKHRSINYLTRQPLPAGEENGGEGGRAASFTGSSRREGIVTYHIFT